MQQTQAFFLQRMNDHVQYLRKIKETLNHEGDFQGCDCHLCALGHWLDHEAPQQVEYYGDEVAALLKQLDQQHCEFHKVSQEALSCSEAGDDAGSYQAMTQMHKLSNQLVNLLLEMDFKAKKAS